MMNLTILCCFLCIFTKNAIFSGINPEHKHDSKKLFARFHCHFGHFGQKVSIFVQGLIEKLSPELFRFKDDSSWILLLFPIQESLLVSKQPL